jgi:hypothetical protein
MDKSTKRWVTIALGVFLALGVLGIAAIGSVVYFVASSIQSEPIAPSELNERFARERQRFSGRQPLLELRDHDAVVVHRPPPSEPAGHPVRSVRVMVYDPDDERITNITIPFEIIRWMPSGRFSISSAGPGIDWERSNLTIADLERFGPGLILDHEDRGGARALVWAE